MSSKKWRSSTCHSRSKSSRKNTYSYFDGHTHVMMHAAMRELARPIIGDVQLFPQERHARSLSPAAPERSKSISNPACPAGPIYRCASDRVAAKLERKDSVLRCGTAIPLLPGLAPSQVLTIRRSWKHINTKGLPEVIRRCFQKLERTNPKALSAFNSPPPSMVQTLTAAAQECHHPEIQRQPSASGPMSPTSICAGVRTTMDHTKYFLSLLDRIIETNQEVDLELKRVGAKHVILYEQYGLGIAEIEKMGEILAEAFFKLDGIRNSKETTKAWSLLFSKLIDHLRDGFETELRYQAKFDAIIAQDILEQIA
ncbi:globin-like protein 9 [Ditylenchus destructor]|uniref:Globin-like protein 9 n=1 Tax=Ditylenchus destructor TaxID=166010 RepID=A0AAD4N7J6_9BILA|nr:globin-like protein 9 [Ditylenchus destructor]